VNSREIIHELMGSSTSSIVGFKVLFQLQYLSIQKHVYLNLTVEITVDIARLVKRSFWGEELFFSS